MFGLGFSEIMVILVVALVVLGPDKLPGVARGLGKALGQFQRGMEEFKREMALPRLDDPLPPPPPTQRRGPRGDTCENRRLEAEARAAEGAAENTSAEAPKSSDESAESTKS